MKKELKELEELRVFEAFAGIGSQRKSLDNINARYKIVGMAEWFLPAIIGYHCMHDNLSFAENTLNKENITLENMVKYLNSKPLSMDSKKVVAQSYWNNKNKTFIEQAYKAVKFSEEKNNIFDIRDLYKRGLEDIDLLTYSFPCQDLSQQGKQAGMSKNNASRSGLLWEIEKALEHANDRKEKLPKYLLMENVSALLHKKNKKDLDLWKTKLVDLGYTNNIKSLNAADFGSPQARNRVFMISSLGGKVSFPEIGIVIQNKFMKDTLDKKHDEDYIIKSLYQFETTKYKETKSHINKCSLKNYTNFNSENYVYDPNRVGPTLTASGANSRIKIEHKVDNVDLGKNNKQFRSLNPKECFRYMGFSTKDFDKINKWNILKPTQLIYLAGNSISIEILSEIINKINDDFNIIDTREKVSESESDKLEIFKILIPIIKKVSPKTLSVTAKGEIEIIVDNKGIIYDINTFFSKLDIDFYVTKSWIEKNDLKYFKREKLFQNFKKQKERDNFKQNPRPGITKHDITTLSSENITIFNNFINIKNKNKMGNKNKTIKNILWYIKGSNPTGEWANPGNAEFIIDPEAKIIDTESKTNSLYRNICVFIDSLYCNLKFNNVESTYARSQSKPIKFQDFLKECPKWVPLLSEMQRKHEKNTKNAYNKKVKELSNWSNINLDKKDIDKEIRKMHRELTNNVKDLQVREDVPFNKNEIKEDSSPEVCHILEVKRTKALLEEICEKNKKKSKKYQNQLNQVKDINNCLIMQRSVHTSFDKNDFIYDSKGNYRPLSEKGQKFMENKDQREVFSKYKKIDKKFLTKKRIYYLKERISYLSEREKKILSNSDIKKIE